MKTRATSQWLAGVAGGLLVAVSALGWAGPPWGPGGIKGALEACEAELQACLEEPCVIFPGDGQTGPELSYTDNGDGTFTDNNTGLMWELKDGDDGVADYSNPHDADNWYTWYEAATVFLDELNGGSEPFADHTDWRLPTVKELHSLVDYSVASPAVSDELPGATHSVDYWSSTTEANRDWNVWTVFFGEGYVSAYYGFKGDDWKVRAVRGGW